MGIREENKKYYREKILKASREIFSLQGYENTTIEQIAEKGGIGLGTVYNYFKSKEELFVLSMADDIAEATEINVDESNFNESNVVEIVTETILKQIRKANYINKKIWKVALPIIFSSMKSDRMPIKEVMKADYKIMDKIRDLLNQLKEKHLLDDTFDTETAVDVIFGALFFQFTVYIYTKDATFEHACEKIKADIRFVFEKKV